MVDWVDVLRRLMALYSVHTQGELGMAMAMPIDVGIDDDIQDSGIPWKILAKAVKENDIDWNWLLTGRGQGPDLQAARRDQAEPEADPEEKRPAPPRLDTRDFARSLLDGDDSALQAQLDDEMQALGEKP